MRKAIAIFVLAALVAAGLILWALKSNFTLSMGQILQSAVVLILVGLAVFFAVSRLRNYMRHEPSEDELSRKIRTKASSLAFYVSIYLWLFIMYISDKTSLPAHSLIGAGIMGLAAVFLLCWLGVKAFVRTHE